MKREVVFKDLSNIKYKDSWDFQESLFNHIINIKLNNRYSDKSENKETPSYLLFCEHPHVYTLGKSGDKQNLLVSEIYLKNLGIEYFKTNRGGDITYHGPGQVVGYPIFDLDKFNLDIRTYLYNLEEVIIRTIAKLGIKSERLKGATGVWLESENPSKTRKICAMGVKASRGVTMHGFALNVNTELKYFKNINPCGFIDKKVTSIEQELGYKVDLKDIQSIIKHEFAQVFECFFVEE